MSNADNDNCQQISNNKLEDIGYNHADSITTNFAVTPETPAEIVAAIPKKESAAMAAVRRYNSSSEAKALREANRKHGLTAQRNRKIDESRKGEGREYHNLAKRVSYAEKIIETENRPVRDYKHHETTEDRVAARQAKDKAAQKVRRSEMTPEQKKQESEKRKARRYAEKERKKQALIDNAIA